MITCNYVNVNKYVYIIQIEVLSKEIIDKRKFNVKEFNIIFIVDSLVHNATY